VDHTDDLMVDHTVVVKEDHTEGEQMKGHMEERSEEEQMTPDHTEGVQNPYHMEGEELMEDHKEGDLKDNEGDLMDHKEGDLVEDHT